MAARALVALLVSGLALPAAASAAEIRTDHRCYVEGHTIALSGGGFTAAAPVTFQLDGKSAGGSAADGRGDVKARGKAPILGKEERFRNVSLTAADAAGRRAATTFKVTKRTVSITPAEGGAPNRVVQFRARGFKRSKTLYVHYVNPRHKLVKTVRLGRVGGACGIVTTSGRLIPFSKPMRGRWRLRFDTREKYSGKTKPQFGLRVTVGK